MSIQDKVILIATLSLSFVVIGMSGMFFYAVLDPTVDDELVFQIIGPGFQTVVGGFVGICAGVKIGQRNETDK